jgi:hypothetical protein
MVGATAIATALVTAAAPAIAAPPQATTQRVSFEGTALTVPNSWPVFDLTDSPSTCVQFNRHAVYLGAPGADQDCPSNAFGHTEAVLIEPAGSAASTGVVDSPNDGEFDRVAGGVRVVASYGTDRATAQTIMASATAASNLPNNPQRSAPQFVSPSIAALSGSATNYTGKGFDPCTAPSASTMNAWLASPYRAIGLYIGGENRACSQANLTAGWLSQQAAAGWHFFPLYVGKQASTSSCTGCSKISSAAADGSAEAADAASKAAALGFAPNAPIVFDMESYSSSSTSTVLTFLASWTSALHAKGYKSGVYSSSSSGIKDLASHYTTTTMPDTIDDALWNGAANTTDPVVASNRWANHQRIHQYAGGHNETYGGATINIDQDYLDVQLAGGVGARTVGDYDGDGRTDLALYRQDCTNGSSWWVSSTGSGAQVYGGSAFGGCADIPAPGDYDGDGVVDQALYRRDCVNGSSWWIKSGKTGQLLNGGTKFGGCTDIPAPGDYDGDGRTDLALYRQDCANGSSWWVKSSASGALLNGGTTYGGCTDIPAPGDYDGDGHTDLALYRQDCANGSSWWVKSSASGALLNGGTTYGGCHDIPAPGDYDGDGHSDLALYRQDCANGSTWWVKSSATGTQIEGGKLYGGCHDIPATS